MNELSQLIKTVTVPVRAVDDAGDPLSEDEQWGGTPGLRKQWLNQPFTSSKKSDTLESVPEDGTTNTTGNTFEIDQEAGIDSPNHLDASNNKVQSNLANCMLGTPGLLIATVLNLFLSMSFGQAFFPSNWDFPAAVPRAIGVQMFLFSTLVCQLVMTTVSDFPTAMGMMMVENIPFMHIIADITIKAKGPGIESFSTVFVAFAISTLAVGVFFYLLGYFKAGNAVYFFPKHVIVGCIGGIGIFIIQTGVEVSCNRAWTWTEQSIYAFAEPPIASHWVASLAFVIVLRIILHLMTAPLLPPFYFVAIPPAFYCILALCGVPVEEARAHQWFFPAAENVDPLLIWELIDFRTVDWAVIGDCIPTIIALCIFR